MIEAFLFDIGNVLVRFDFGKVFERLAPFAGGGIAEVERAIRAMEVDIETGRMNAEEFIASATGLIGGSMARAEFADAFCDIFSPNLPMWQAVEDISRRMPVYLFSNTSELHETYLFQRYPIFGLFRGGCYSWRLGSMKPDEPIYRAALQLTGLPAARIAYIDDLPANIATGQRIGFHCHLYHAEKHDDFMAFLDGARGC